MLTNKLRKQVHTREQRYFGLLRSEHWYFLTDVLGKLIGPETSVRNYHQSLRNNPQERSFHLIRA